MKLMHVDVLKYILSMAVMLLAIFGIFYITKMRKKKRHQPKKKNRDVL